MKYLYKIEDGEVIAALFEDDAKPKGWYESPKEAQKPKRRVKRDNSTNSDK